MRILVLESSGNKNGSSNMLAKEFIRGAQESGNEVTEFDVFQADIRPCIGCNHCGMAGPCVQKDDYETKLKEMIRETDMIVSQIRIISGLTKPNLATLRNLFAGCFVRYQGRWILRTEYSRRPARGCLCERCHRPYRLQ